jgi:hypothetical protein
MIVQQLVHQDQHQEDIMQVVEVGELKVHQDHLMQEEQVVEELEEIDVQQL